MEESKQFRQVLIGLSLINNGDWDDIFENIKAKNRSDEALKAGSEFKGKALAITEEGYGGKLRAGYKPPFVLYLEGNESLIGRYEESVAYINGVNSSEYATDKCEEILMECGKTVPIVVPFGQKILRRTIERLVDSGAKVVAVLAKGRDWYDDQADKILLGKIARSGLIVSEIPPDVCSPKNGKGSQMKILSMLSNRMLVGGISKKDSLYMAIGYATAVGSEVFCIPFQAGSKYINNELIREGAILVENAEQLLKEKL